MSEQTAYRCGVKAMLEVTGGKWKPLVLYHLLSGTKRFGELKGLIAEGITQRSLTLQLRELEAHGVIERKVYAQVPPRVEYTLTDLGLTLGPVMLAMKEWGVAYQAHGGIFPPETTLGIDG
jgi:DNA-binding HxlR family transcriptional regulator